MAPTETEGGGASLKDTQKILLNKSSSMSFCNPALYYQYVAAKCCNQASLFHANQFDSTTISQLCQLQLPRSPLSTPSLFCPLPPFYLIFSGICRGCYICIIYHIRLEYAPLQSRACAYQRSITNVKYKMQSFAFLMLQCIPKIQQDHIALKLFKSNMG